MMIVKSVETIRLVLRELSGNFISKGSVIQDGVRDANLNFRE